MSKYTELLSEYLENNELPAIYDDTLNLKKTLQLTLSTSVAVTRCRNILRRNKWNTQN